MIAECASGFIVFWCAVCAVDAACTTTNITTCPSAGDVEVYQESSWTNLIVQCPQETCQLPQTLSGASFQKSPNLEEVYIVGNTINLEEDTFSSLTKLRVLSFFKVAALDVRRGSFSGIKNLNRLDLKQNGIRTLERDAFENSQIKQINLSANNLTRIRLNILNLPSLQSLTISHNQLTQIAEGAFHENLEHLDLSHNRLSMIPLGVLNNLKNLKTLLLNNNALPSVTPFPGLVSLRKLDLGHNSIEGLSNDAFTSFAHLKELYLHRNRIFYLNPKSFARPSPLQTLYLHGNKLVFLPGELGAAFTTLKRMTIGGNPWACPCLSEVQNFIGVVGVDLEECDRKFFGSGDTPICLSTASKRCVGNEWEDIVQNQMDSVHMLMSGYKC